MALIRLAIKAAAILLLPILSPGAALADSSPSEAHASRSEEQRLKQVFKEDAERQDQLDPLDVLYRGEPVDPQALASLFTDGLDRASQESARQALKDLASINPVKLGPQARLSYDVFARQKREDLAWLQPDVRSLTGVRPFNHFGGLHVEFPSLMSSTGAFVYEKPEDYAEALALHAAFGQVLAQAEVRFREGMASGIVEPKLTVRNMIEQIDAMLSEPIEKSPFYSPVLEFPEAVSQKSRDAIRADFADSIVHTLRPAYRKFRNFLADEYLPAARDREGLWALRDGPALYRRLIEKETSISLDPDEVHQLGLAEVERIKRRMTQVKDKLGFTGPLDDFFGYVRTAPEFHPQTREQLTEAFMRIHREVDAVAPRYFARMPRTPLRIEPYPTFREKHEPGGSYYQGSPDGTRPGTFYYNTYDLSSRFISGVTTLYLHEGIPGHHLQVSLAQEDEDLPDFQRFGIDTAYVEGWALYAESLGYEMGLFSDPIQEWGNLDDEMLRAMRLVVDTGIHAKGWSSQQAIDYMLANSGMGRTDSTAEVERYVANPAQALAYKVGALKIRELRDRAEKSLGDRFDIREFHAQVLGSGSLPLPVLEAKIDAWIAARR